MSKHTKESLAILGRRLRRSASDDQPAIPRKAVTLYLQPELRDRLDSAYFKLKANGSRISRPDFCEAIIEAGLNQFDTMPDDLEVSRIQPQVPAQGATAEEGLAAITAED
ncbi:MAG: hypothetical protein OXG78_06855 [Chloroflexi bacterium]|nr:hypothetical protein [Chloroflexota bacterium]